MTISLIKVEGNINSAINFNSSDIKINYDEDDSFLKEKNEIQVCILNAENDEKTENISSINLIVEKIAFSSNNNENKTIKASIKSNKNVEIEFTHDEQINDNNLVIESPEGSVKQVLSEKHQTYNVDINGTLVNYTTNYLISSQIKINSGNYFNSESNENIFVVIDGGVLTLNPGVELNKNFNSTTNNLFPDQENNSDRRLAAIIEQETNNDNTSDEEEKNTEEENSEQEEEISVDYGQNSAIVVLGTGKVIINGIKITSSFVNSHGIVAINGGKVIISNSTISTEGDNSKGIYSLYEGSINATNVIISSLGENSPNIATGIGTGSINAEKMKLSTLNFRSPLIDTGDGDIISIKNSTGTTNISNIIIIDGNSNTSINNCIFSGVGQGILGYDDAGILIYQKVYDNNKLSYLDIYNSKISIIKYYDDLYDNAPLFLVTNIHVTITLNNTETSLGSGKFLIAEPIDVLGGHGSSVTLIVLGKSFEGSIISTDSFVDFQHSEDVSQGGYSNNEGVQETII